MCENFYIYNAMLNTNIFHSKLWTFKVKTFVDFIKPQNWNFSPSKLLHMRLLYNRVESESDDPDYLGHLLVDQAGLIRKLNYLDVTRMFNRSQVLYKRHWCLISEWILGLVGALNHHWCKASHLPQAALKHMVSKDFILKSTISCQLRMKKSMALFHI